VNHIGIMQGRLSPAGARAQSFPFASWLDEFDRARDCGFDCIEWLLTAEHLDDNPFWSDVAVVDLRRVTARTGVSVRSVCADCFITQPLVGSAGAELRARCALLDRIIARSAELGAAVVLVPILEGNAIRDAADEQQLLDALAAPLARAQAAGVRLALESDRSAATQRDLIARAQSPALGAYYDTGNAAAAGWDLVSDVNTLGPVLCGIHVKDRPRAAASVMLGAGAVDFDRFWPALAAAGYAGPVIFETPVGADPVDSAHRNLAFLTARRPQPASAR
jgi:L-ribulose-5-phosphate 3-epimerase